MVGALAVEDKFVVTFYGVDEVVLNTRECIIRFYAVHNTFDDLAVGDVFWVNIITKLQELSKATFIEFDGGNRHSFERHFVFQTAHFSKILRGCFGVECLIWDVGLGVCVLQ